MKEIWTKRSRNIMAKFVNVPPMVAWPKPAQKPLCQSSSVATFWMRHGGSSAMAIEGCHRRPCTLCPVNEYLPNSTPRRFGATCGRSGRPPHDAGGAARVVADRDPDIDDTNFAGTHRGDRFGDCRGKLFRVLDRADADTTLPSRQGCKIDIG